jgi:hypothetical protein
LVFIEQIQHLKDENSIDPLTELCSSVYRMSIARAAPPAVREFLDGNQEGPAGLRRKTAFRRRFRRR